MEQSAVGIDVGALTVKAVLLTETGWTPTPVYRFHHGNPPGVVCEALEQLVPHTVPWIGVTGSGAPLFKDNPRVLRVNSAQAAIAAVRKKFPTAYNILDIGGASLTLVRLNAAGRFRSYSANSQCAAGTGSFLDEQAMRLGLSYDELLEFDGVAKPPSVATRCAVFAKCDLIQLQQAGTTLQEMWDGLCRSMSQTALQTLLKGKPLGAPTAVIGGVAQNGAVLRWLRVLADAEILADSHSHLASAYGAGLIALAQEEWPDQPATAEWRTWLNDVTRVAIAIPTMPPRLTTRCDRKPSECCTIGPTVIYKANTAKPLALERTRYPSFAVKEEYVDGHGNEVRVSSWPSCDPIRATLGIDIGSTSTKLCLVDEAGQVLADVYRRTAGDPVGATRKLFGALEQLASAKGARWEIVGCGTTGSGRRLVGAVVGADWVVNEISAQVAGAMHLDPELESIFEIGGQDSKYMRTRQGCIVDANMNYMCAAGTGSFVEEQARKLGVPLDQVGDRVLGTVPPQASDRCTVFMEQDINQLLRSGHDIEQALAAVMRSVVQNYLRKVVGDRPISRHKIGLQGATARNKGLVAAFETLLDVEMVVSPYCHVMGALGVALLTQQHLSHRGRATTFIGLELSTRRVSLRREPCGLCNNQCQITFADIEGVGHEPSWGYLCGRDPDDSKMRVLREFDLFRKRARWLWAVGAMPRESNSAGATGATRAAGDGRKATVGLPRALTTYSHLPLWRRLLEELGAKVVLTAESDCTTRERGAAAEFCFPVKLAHGQVAQSLADTTLDYLLVPHMVAEPPTGKQSNTFLCPYVQSFPAVACAAIPPPDREPSRLLMPILDRRLPISRQVNDLFAVLGPALGVPRGQVAKALHSAVEAQEEFGERCVKAGRETLARLSEAHASHGRGQVGIVLLGRPYNVNDAKANLDLPRRIAEMGFVVVPVDCLPFEPDRIDPTFHNVFWAYGQRLLSALEFIRNCDYLFGICLTNYGCGPDSFLMSYAEHVMGDKPLLSLELDEQGADTSYLTRIEAFLDVVGSWKPAPRKPRAPSLPEDVDEVRSRQLWMPPIHPVLVKLGTSLFRSEGYDAAAMPTETQDDLEVGQRVTRGCECLPMRTNIGSFINAAAREPEKRHALFMPTATGPCRFGQYNTLERLILERMGRTDICIMSPTSANSYYGLGRKLLRRSWHAIMTSDLLLKLALRVRPYEKTPGDGDETLERWVGRACRAISDRESLRELIREAGRDFGRIPTRNERRSVVGVVGEIYVRNNEFCNEGVVRMIEGNGGEAWVAPMTEWIFFTAYEDGRRFSDSPKRWKCTIDYGKRFLAFQYLRAEERAFHRAAGPLLSDRHEPAFADVISAGLRYLPFNVAGETLITLGRAVELVSEGVALIVNTAPFGCMAGTVTAALFSQFEDELGVPVVNLFYDGRGDENRRLEVFLANLPADRGRSGPPGMGLVH